MRIFSNSRQLPNHASNKRVFIVHSTCVYLHACDKFNVKCGRSASKQVMSAKYVIDFSMQLIQFIWIFHPQMGCWLMMSHGFFFCLQSEEGTDTDAGIGIYSEDCIPFKLFTFLRSSFLLFCAEFEQQILLPFDHAFIIHKQLYFDKITDFYIIIYFRIFDFYILCIYYVSLWLIFGSYRISRLSE